MAVPRIQRLIPKGRGSKKRPYDELPELQSSYLFFFFTWLWWSLMASEAPSYGLNLKLSWGSMTLLQCCALYTHKKIHAQRAPHGHTNLHSMCAHPLPSPSSPLLLQSLDPPLIAPEKCLQNIPTKLSHSLATHTKKMLWCTL